MKRKLLFIIFLIGIATLGFGQRRTRVQKIIQLTEPKTSGSISFEEALSKLQTVFRFTGRPVERTAIGQLVWAGLGNRQTPKVMPTVPPEPTEPVFPTQLQVITNEGVFYYQPLTNSLEQIQEGDVRGSLAAATSMPDSVTSAGCIIAITSSVTRGSTRRSTDSGRNTMLLEAGHIAQNIMLQAVSLNQGLGSVVISDFDSRAAAQACGISRSLDVLYLVCVGYSTDQDVQANGDRPAATPKKALVIVPPEGFDDAEFFETLNTLNAAQIQVVVASSTIGTITSVSNTPFEVRVRADNVRAEDFDGVIIIGGPGAGVFIADEFVLNLVRRAFDTRKIIGATSLGTSVLASSGILSNGLKVTGIPEEAENIGRLGANFTGQLVERDLRVITCSGPNGARLFAIEVADAITDR